MRENTSRRVAIVVPAFNEEKNLANVLKEIEKHCIDCDIIVVNDGSTDGTMKIAKEIAEENEKITLLSHPFNIGGGAAVQTGVKLAYLEGYDYVVQVDADGQHDPSEVRKLLMPLYNDEADLIIGSRFLENVNYKTSYTRLLGIKFYSKIASILIKQRITDINSGFKAMNKKIIAYIAEDYPSRHPAFESTVKIGRKGFRIKEVPVHMKQRKYGKSEFTIKRLILYPFKIFLSFIKALWLSHHL